MRGLTRKQMMEIVAFDWKRRTGLDFDKEPGEIESLKAVYAKIFKKGGAK